VLFIVMKRIYLLNQLDMKNKLIFVLFAALLVGGVLGATCTGGN
jgi:hypothetical protein